MFDADIKFPQGISYFTNLHITQDGKSRLASRIAVLSFFINCIDQSSDWINRVKNTIRTIPELPNCDFKSIGFDDIEIAFQQMSVPE